jgi:hypothetical protein
MVFRQIFIDPSDHQHINRFQKTPLQSHMVTTTTSAQAMWETALAQDQTLLEGMDGKVDEK